MRTDFIVVGQEPIYGTAPEGTVVHCVTSEEAFAEAHRMIVECVNAVVTVWARQGRNMWPVRILFPKTRPVLDQQYGIPYANMSDAVPTYMVNTTHPAHVIPYPTEEA